MGDFETVHEDGSVTYEFGQFTLKSPYDANGNIQEVQETEHDKQVKQHFPVGCSVSAWQSDREEYVPARVTEHGINFITVRHARKRDGVYETIYPTFQIAVKRGVITGFDPSESLVYR